MTDPILCTIQGNIGAGKSCLVRQLKLSLEAVGKKVCFLQEPVDSIWSTIKDESGEPILSLYYKDQEKYAFSFQMMAYISRLSILKKALSQDYDIIIAERSLSTDRHVFAQMLRDENKIKHVEHEIYLRWFDEFQNDFPDEKVVYLKTTPETASARVTKRAREGESIPLEYLANCHQYHENWLAKKDDVLVLDGNVDIDVDPSYSTKRIADVADFISRG